MNNRPIGVFDSGLGGLTAVKQLKKILPAEDIVYFGDTGRVPYGAKGPKTIIRYAKQDIAFLLSKNVKTVLAACGTVSSVFPKSESDALPVPYIGVVDAAAKAAAARTKNGKVGIIGTEATVASGSFDAALHGLVPSIETVANACPLFVPLVEYGYTDRDDPMAALAAEEYLAPIKAAGVDTVILGCTHYPLLADVIEKYFGNGIQLVDPGKEAALVLRRQLTEQNALTTRTEQGRTAYYVSDEPDRFEEFAGLFLGQAVSAPPQKVDIDTF